LAAQKYEDKQKHTTSKNIKNILASIKSIVSRDNNKNKRRRRRRGFIYLPQDNTKMQTLGSGRTSLRIEKELEQNIAPVSPATWFLGTTLNASREFIQYASSYRYFKIMKVAVVFEPQCDISIQGKTYVMLNWGNGETNNLELEDSSKVVSAYRTRKIILKYKPPNINVQSPNGMYNPRAWLPAADTSFEYIRGDLTMQNTTTFTVRARLIIVVAFAGNRVLDAAKLEELTVKIKKIEAQNKLEKEEKKQEDEKEINTATKEIQ
jgi:hypothetical protein